MNKTTVKRSTKSNLFSDALDSLRLTVSIPFSVVPEQTEPVRDDAEP